MSAFLARSGKAEDFRSGRGAALDTAFARNWMPFARNRDRWQRANSWVEKFGVFADNMLKAEGREPVPLETALASSRLCFLFLVEVAEEKKGFSRVRAARRFLSEQRIRDGGRSLNGDAKIALLLDGVDNAEPRQRKQKEALDVNEVRTLAVSKHGGRSPDWFRRQTTTMVMVGFVTLMRLDEVRRLLRSGVRFRFRSGQESSWDGKSAPPRVDTISGLLLLVTWRKSGQSKFAWIPMSCRMAVAMLVSHLSFLVASESRDPTRSVDPYLFRSRRRAKGAGWVPSRSKVDSRSFRCDMRAALCSACEGIDKELALSFGGHSMRIGGSNWMRQVGGRLRGCLIPTPLSCVFRQ